MANSVIIGSSCESSVGVGTLLKFDSDKVISIHFNEDRGFWVIEEQLEDGGFRSWFCYNVMKLEADLLGAWY